MAFNQPSPAVTVEGTFRALNTYKTGEKSVHGEGHDAGRAQILTDRGGFLDVYVDPSQLPDVRQLGPGSQVRWLIEVDVFTRTSAKGSKWSELSARLVEDLDRITPDDEHAIRELASTLGAHVQV